MMDSSKQGNSSAKVVDTMRLQAIHSDKFEQVKRLVRDYNYKYKDISLVKEWEEWVIFAFDMDGREEHDAIMVRDDYPQFLLCTLYSYHVDTDVFHFTDEETDVWRCRYLESLISIVKRPKAIEAGLSKEWAVGQIVGTTRQMLAQVMPFYTPDEYAEKVSTQIITEDGI